MKKLLISLLSLFILTIVFSTSNVFASEQRIQDLKNTSRSSIHSPISTRYLQGVRITGSCSLYYPNWTPAYEHYGIARTSAASPATLSVSSVIHYIDFWGNDLFANNSAGNNGVTAVQATTNLTGEHDFALRITSTHVAVIGGSSVQMQTFVSLADS